MKKDKDMLMILADKASARLGSRNKKETSYDDELAESLFDAVEDRDPKAFWKALKECISQCSSNEGDSKDASDDDTE